MTGTASGLLKLRVGTTVCDLWQVHCPNIHPSSPTQPGHPLIGGLSTQPLGKNDEFSVTRLAGILTLAC